MRLLGGDDSGGDAWGARGEAPSGREKSLRGPAGILPFFLGNGTTTTHCEDQPVTAAAGLQRGRQREFRRPNLIHTIPVRPLEAALVAGRASPVPPSPPGCRRLGAKEMGEKLARVMVWSSPMFFTPYRTCIQCNDRQISS